MARCVLHRVFVEDGVAVTGYSPEGRYVVAEDWIVIGRSKFSAIAIRAPIGGMKTYALFHRNGDWIFKANNEWAIASVNGEPLETRLGRRTLRDGDVVEICDIDKRPVHRFRFELIA